jgi:ribosomal protein S18 acetylase RimI-like enzyme
VKGCPHGRSHPDLAALATLAAIWCQRLDFGPEATLVTEVLIPLTIRDLTQEDLPACSWFGSPRDLARLGQVLERVRRGEVDYLAACPPSGLPVALGGIDYTLTPGAGTLWQLAVHATLQSCGIGTLLIHAAEQRIRVRGLHRAELAVEESNPRARALYERLGYAAYASKPESWDVDTEDGSITRYETMCALMRKELR